MGLFEKIFKKPARQILPEEQFFQTLTTYTPVFTSFGGQIYESELVRAAIDAKARHIAKLKVEVHGSAKSKLQTQIRQNPNTWQSWYQFLYRLETILEIQNTSFIVPVFNEYGEIGGYYPILPSRATMLEYKGDPWIKYQFSNGNQAAIELSAVGILTKHQYSSEFFGESNTALNSTLDLMDIQKQGIQEGIKNAATYRFMAKVNNFSFSEDLKKERKRFSKENLEKDSDGGGLLLFPNTYSDIKQIESKPFVIDPKEMEIIRTNVFEYFGVNEKILENRAYGDEFTAFYEGVVEPFAIQFSEVMTNMTFSVAERRNKNFIIATANRLQYMSNTEKLQVSSQMADRGIMNRDEIREIWNLPPLPDGQGQVYTIRGEYYLMNSDGSTTKHGDDLTSKKGENNGTDG